MTEFDKTETYNQEVAQKVFELLQACNKNHMPVFISVCVKNDENGTEYRNEMFAAASNDIQLKKDLLPKFVNVINGFETVLPNEIVEIDYD